MMAVMPMMVFAVVAEELGRLRGSGRRPTDTKDHLDGGTATGNEMEAGDYVPRSRNPASRYPKAKNDYWRTPLPKTLLSLGSTDEPARNSATAGPPRMAQMLRMGTIKSLRRLGTSKALQGDAEGSSLRSKSLKSKRDSLELKSQVEEMKQLRKLTGDGKYIHNVHENMRDVQGQLYRLQQYIVALVMVTLVLGILVNELCARNDYVSQEPSLAEVIRIKEQNGRACPAYSAEYIKMLLSVLTAVLVTFVVQQWRLRVRMRERNKRIEEYYFMPDGTQLKRAPPLYMYASLVIEVVICAIHPVPFIHRDIEVQFILEAPLFYRFESATVGLMFLRSYLLWRWFRLIAFYRFLCLEDSFVMEDYSALDQMHLSANISAQSFPLKVMVLKYPVRVIASIMSVIFFSACYVLRITEGPAYQPHSDNWWDQMWVTITQGTTGYGGSTPVTQWGRFCSVLMMLLGPMAVSFMTATTSKAITLTNDEHALLTHMEANTCKVKVLTAAAELIQYWWRDVLEVDPRFQRQQWWKRRSQTKSPLSSPALRPCTPASARTAPPPPLPRRDSESSGSSESAERRGQKPFEGTSSAIQGQGPNDAHRLEQVEIEAQTDSARGVRPPRHSISAPQLLRSGRHQSAAPLPSAPPARPRAASAVSLHLYSAGIGHVARLAKRRSLTRTARRSSVSTASAASVGRASSAASVDLPMAATNPIALRFVHMLGQPYRDAKRVLLVRNFYTALAAYDRLMAQHCTVSAGKQEELLPLHKARADALEGIAGSAYSQLTATDLELAALRSDVEGRLDELSTHVLQTSEAVQRIQSMLAALLAGTQPVSQHSAAGFVGKVAPRDHGCDEAPSTRDVGAPARVSLRRRELTKTVSLQVVSASPRIVGAVLCRDRSSVQLQWRCASAAQPSTAVATTTRDFETRGEPLRELTKVVARQVQRSGQWQEGSRIAEQAPAPTSTGMTTSNVVPPATHRALSTPPARRLSVPRVISDLAVVHPPQGPPSQVEGAGVGEAAPVATARMHPLAVESHILSRTPAGSTGAMSPRQPGLRMGEALDWDRSASLRGWRDPGHCTPETVRLA